MTARDDKAKKTQRRRQWARGVLAACAAHIALLAAISLAGALGPDRWWLSGLNMYLPQWIWAIPILGLLPLSIWLSRRWSWIPLLSVLWVAGAIMGFRWSSAVSPKGARIRVMTYNAQWWQVPLADPLALKIKRFDPDIVCLQDARGAADAGLRELLEGWHVSQFGQYIIAAKYPTKATVVGDISFRGEK